MLTGDLLRFQKRGTFKPLFVNPENVELQQFAGDLITIFSDALPAAMSAGEIELLSESVIRRENDLKLGQGLYKLLLDRSEFGVLADVDYPALRKKLFLLSSQALESCRGELNQYRKTIQQEPELAEFCAGDIYGDLPELERLRTFRPLSARELLCRYNLALAQGLLMYASKVVVSVESGEPAQLRRLFKYLKFFRLLAELRSRGQGRMTMEISGPFALFANARKYALQLASFFPAVVNLPCWKLAAEIEFHGRKGKMVLDQSSGLLPIYRNFSAYVPEEIQLFHRHFQQECRDWKIIGETPFIEGVKPELIFPDLSFQHLSDGKVIHLELFHRWHKGQLEKRLAFLEAHPDLPLVLGIDRALADDDAFAVIEAQYPKVCCYRFRDFPGVERTVKKLEEAAARLR